MDIDELMAQVTETYKYCIAEGQSVTINHMLPWVEVNRGKNEHGDDDTYFFQGEEASDLIDSCPEYLNEEEYILWSAQGW